MLKEKCLPAFWLWPSNLISPQKVQGYCAGSGGQESTRKVGALGLIPGLERSLEKGMAAHSSILAWGIPWTEEPGELQSFGLQRVRHD